MRRGRSLGVVMAVVVVCLATRVGAVVLFPGGSGVVTGSVTDIGGGEFEYSYTVTNTSDGSLVPDGGIGVAGPDDTVINRLLIPFFDLESVAIVNGSVQFPLGWTATFSDPAGTIWDYNPLTDPDQLNYEVSASVFVDPPFVLDFFTVSNPVQPDASLDGFSFRSLFGATNGPVVIGFEGGGGSVDPPHVNSPSHPAFDVIPEPTTMALLALGGLGLLRRRQKPRDA